MKSVFVMGPVRKQQQSLTKMKGHNCCDYEDMLKVLPC